MDLLESAWGLAVSGLVCGIFIGAVARHNHFCTLNALERHWYAADSRGLRAWVLAATVAMITTQLLMATNIAPAQDNFYLNTPLHLPSAIFGGILFGFGMALVGTCGFGALVRLGGGSLRSLIIVFAIGIAALAMQRGLFGTWRVALQSKYSIDFSWAGSQSIGDIASALTNLPLHYPIALIAASTALFWVFKSAEFRSSARHVWSGLAIGLAVTFGWLVTSRFQATLFEPVQLESTSFVMPNGEFIMQLVANTGAVPDYGIGMIVGVVLGAYLASKFSGNIRWEACDSAPELARHLFGAVLMGAGGVLALGCTIGQGVSAMSMMAVSAPIVFVCILIGAKMGLSYILGDTPEFFKFN